MDWKTYIVVDLLKGAEIVNETQFDEDRALIRIYELKNGDINITFKLNNQYHNTITGEDWELLHRGKNKYLILCDKNSSLYKHAFKFYVLNE